MLKPRKIAVLFLWHVRYQGFSFPYKCSQHSYWFSYLHITFLECLTIAQDPLHVSANILVGTLPFYEFPKTVRFFYTASYWWQFKTIALGYLAQDPLHVSANILVGTLPFYEFPKTVRFFYIASYWWQFKTIALGHDCERVCFFKENNSQVFNLN